MIGQQVSHYRVGERLGRGGMGVVYAAEDLRLGRRVAIKFLVDEAQADSEAAARFMREARAISALNHPHICTLHDIGVHDGQHFMVMELLEGEPLKARIARGPLPVDDVILFAEQIADALDAAHAKGIIHRDLKPANLFVTTREQVKVLDFGVAKLAEVPRAGATDETVAPVPPTTSTGSAIGTIQYMSPEQARGQEIDARSDIFSLGLVIHEMATGQTAFSGATPALVFDGILRGTLAPPSSTVDGVPVELDAIVRRATEKNRDQRYQSAAEMRADLARLRTATDGARLTPPAGVRPAAVVEGDRHAMPAATPPPRRAVRSRWWMIAAPVATLAIIGAVVLWRSTQTPALAHRDTVVLSAFTNRTGDTMFDDTLSEALAVQLRQSPFLNVMPEQQQQATLRLMGRDADTPLTADVGREVCQRAGGKALLGGSIASLGSAYLVTLSAQDCVTAQVVAEEQVQASSKEGVLHALSEGVRRFRERLGESLASIQRYDAPVEQASTSSLEALKAYSQGTVTRRITGDFDSVPFFRRAVEIDPNFALAYARLGTVYSNMGRMDEAREAATKAYELRERVSDRERYYIEARYFTTVTNEPEKAIDAYTLLLATYPDDYAARANTGILLREGGRVDEAIPMLEGAVASAPDQPNAHLNLGYALIDAERYDDARASFEKSMALQDSTNAHSGLFVIATLTRDAALAAEQIEATRGRRDEVNIIGVRIQAAMYQGRLREARQLAEDWLLLMARDGRAAHLGEPSMGMVISEVELGAVDAAAARFSSLQQRDRLDADADDEVLVYAALTGNGALARQVAPRLRQTATGRLEADELLRFYDALQALAEGRPADAVRRLDPPLFTAKHAQMLGVWAWAHRQLGTHAEVLRVCDHLLERYTPLGLNAQVPRLMVERARALTGLGRVDEARRAYDAFFTFWRDADADVPLLVEARGEAAKLAS
ncbi:MAG: protein kinase [Acidobacteria bacterium]|nr:protein kinase [Acidobacteriota bacterium]